MSEGDELRGEIDDLRDRLDEIESESEKAGPRGAGSRGLSLGYAMGMSIAIVLSWSRNTSILWCVLHGLLSWVYVIYFAATR